MPCHLSIVAADPTPAPPTRQALLWALEEGMAGDPADPDEGLAILCQRSFGLADCEAVLAGAASLGAAWRRTARRPLPACLILADPAQARRLRRRRAEDLLTLVSLFLAGADSHASGLAQWLCRGTAGRLALIAKARRLADSLVRCGLAAGDLSPVASRPTPRQRGGATPLPCLAAAAP
ncbi:hypothetical protein [Roseospirillum parvum]|uniref:Uncharacterized protein n=1 Tax=Roseospirillum parvum TaxID=83401 RepID=A0A1G7WA82_9PROT|nr:hypothetical protein [Roseospirillum parvum]SDG68852.1 hypothetical protein SAMN05421742_102128 [Roseospirillum parvum]